MQFVSFTLCIFKHMLMRFFFYVPEISVCRKKKAVSSRAAPLFRGGLLERGAVRFLHTLHLQTHVDVFSVSMCGKSLCGGIL